MVHTVQVGQARDPPTAVEAVGDITPCTPKTAVADEQHPTTPPAPVPTQQQQREFLQGMSPPSSPVGDSPCNGPPVVPDSSTEAAMGKPPPAVIPAAAEHVRGNGFATTGASGGGCSSISGVAVPEVAPSYGSRQTEESAKLPEGGGGGGEGGDGISRAPRRSIETVLQPAESQVRLGPAEVVCLCLGASIVRDPERSRRFDSVSAPHEDEKHPTTKLLCQSPHTSCSTPPPPTFWISEKYSVILYRLR